MNHTLEQQPPARARRAPSRLRTATLSGAVIAALVAPLAAAPPAMAQTVTVEGVHADVIALDITDRSLDMFSYVDFPDRHHAKVDPAEAEYVLPDDERTRRSVPSGYEFVAPEGEEIIMAPQTQIQGVLWPGWNTEDIRRGEIRDDALTLELTDTKTPEGASVEVFQDSFFGGPQRIWSSDEEQYRSYRQPVESHVHSNWAFTQPGRYELTFRATGTAVTGENLEAEQTYVFLVGEQESAEEPKPEPPADPTEEPSPPPITEPTANPTGEPSGAPSDLAPPQDPTTPPGPADPAPSAPADPAPSAEAPTHAPGDAGGPAALGQPDAGQPGSGQGGSASGQSGSATGARGSGQTTSAGSGSGGSAPAQCIPTEVPLPGAAGEPKASSGSRAGQADASGRQDAERRTPSLSAAQDRPGAAPQAVDVATSGHFDIGPEVKGGRLSPAVKDDRTSPAVWKDPRTVIFGLGDAAKTKMPSGMEEIAPAGSEVHLIGATQQDGVPWVGWNTQSESLLRDAAGPMTMTLASMDGPGELSVFLSGNFGSRSTPVFGSSGQKSFTVPLHTHQHGNWVFTRPGDYRVSLDLSVPLKSGGTQTARAELRFAVGQEAVARAQARPGTVTVTEAPQGAKTDAAARPADAGNAAQGAPTVAEQGVITKPDGAQVRIVGKTASGEDCELTAEQRAQAEAASREGRLAHTGADARLWLTVGAGAALLAAGTAAVLVVRRRRAL